jgi:hypothetical protein
VVWLYERDNEQPRSKSNPNTEALSQIQLQMVSNPDDDKGSRAEVGLRYRLRFSRPSCHMELWGPAQSVGR